MKFPSEAEPETSEIEGSSYRIPVWRRRCIGRPHCGILWAWPRLRMRQPSDASAICIFIEKLCFRTPTRSLFSSLHPLHLSVLAFNPTLFEHLGDLP
jgi:hypothetical protein